MISTLEKDFSEFYLLTPDDFCILTPDWKSDDPNDGIYGFYVSDDFGLCPYYSDYDYTYASTTFDDAGEPLSMTGPFGY